MQTFLPCTDFKASADALDQKRCWKQVVEAKQILCILRAKGLPKEWKLTKSYKNQPFKNHPAVKMWAGYEEALKYYYNIFLSVCKSKWHIKTSMPGFSSLNLTNRIYPWWLGYDCFHDAMKARLIEKAPSYYASMWPKFKGYNNGNYWWPDNETKTFYLINP